MAVAQGYGKTVTSGSVFAYDTGDTRNSYIGEPTTNLALFSVISGITFNGDYATLTSQTADYNVTYRGRPSLKLISTGQWNIYKYPRSGNYTATSSTAFTFSWKMKWSDGRVPSINNGYIYTDAQYFYPSVTVTAMEDGWYLCQTTSSGTSSPVWLTGFTTTQYGTCYITDWQAEANSHATQFTPAGTTRSATQGLLPVVGNSTINLSNVSFDSNAQMVFDGTNDYVNLGASSNWAFGGNGTVELMVKPTDSTGNNRLWCVDNNSTSLDAFLDTTSYKIFLHGGVVGALTPLTQNAWNHVVVTYTGGTVQIYINGTPATMDGTTTGYSMSNSGTLYLGCYTDLAYNLYGEIPIFKTYNRALTTSEIKQNFRHYRTRFGMEYDTFYFAVSNRNARYVQQWWEQEPILDEEGNPTGEYITLDEGFVKGKNMAATTPAYTLYRKPSETYTGPGDYVEVARDDIGTPARLTQYGVQTKYPTGRYFTSVTVRKDNATGEISFEFPDGGTSQYGEAFYKTIITPYVP